MLCLSRKVGQRVAVGNVLVTVLAVRGPRVKLGFEGPRETIVAREETKRKAGMGAGELDLVLDHDVNKRRSVP